MTTITVTLNGILIRRIGYGATINDDNGPDLTTMDLSEIKVGKNHKPAHGREPCGFAHCALRRKALFGVNCKLMSREISSHGSHGIL